jgi:hypothetical protein
LEAAGEKKKAFYDTKGFRLIRSSNEEKLILRVNLKNVKSFKDVGGAFIRFPKPVPL